MVKGNVTPMSTNIDLMQGDRGTRRVTQHDIWALGPDVAANLEGFLRAEAERRGLKLTIWALQGSEYDFEFQWEPANTEVMYDAVLINPDGTEYARMHVDTVNGAPRHLIEHTLETPVALANGRTQRDVVVSGWAKDDDTSVPPEDVRYRLDWIERRTDNTRTP